MKFGKRMRSLATPQWEGDYVDYKQLKKTIRVLLATQQQQQDAPPSPRDAFLAALEVEMQKLNNAHDRIYKELFDQELRLLRNTLGNKWVLSASQARFLLCGAIELSNKVDAFRRFIVLNSLAIVKISKKFDKLCPGTKLKKQVMDDLLKKQPFYDGAAKMDTLCAAVGTLTDRVMLCVLPDGNFRISDHKVSCPVCLQTEVKSAITLSCQHTFCWSCLSKAVEHRFHSCPMCRKEQSIDPRDYAIDGLLMRFKRAYDFVEDSLDRAPFASSPMRQNLLEAFELVNGYLNEIQAKYAELSPRNSIGSQENLSFAAVSSEENQKVVDVPLLPTATAEQAPTEVVCSFAKGDAVEVRYDGEWYPGMVLHVNDGDAATYAVLWWMHDQSQRCGQRMPRHLMRHPVFPDDHHHHHSTPYQEYLLADLAAGAWKTATQWALEPFRRLRSLSGQEPNSTAA